MKQLKEPKKWKHPRLYMAVSANGHVDNALRIIYPSGRGDWVTSSSGEDLFDFACWEAIGSMDEGSSMSTNAYRPEKANQSRKNMINFLKETQELTVVFIGEIK